MREESIFIEALEREDPTERAAFLDRACATDPALRSRIERLIGRHQQADDSLEVPSAWAPTIDVNALEVVGSVIGPYRLMEAIGEGGMGVVYVAEQHEPVRRKVALKVIKPGMDSRQVVARFEAERQALALMDHPNIAKVHDAGTTDSGRPYFVMELVRGLLITDYCDREQLSIPERLELFVLVCRAVQHAHQKGVIHRDLKPSNVLVTVIDDVAVPKVIDFGVAKATGASLTERTIYTGFHQFVGTPLYMSPEQADLSGVDVDTRSDVYAMGVLLYELLTGTTPFDPETLKLAAFDEMRRIIREHEPQRPSARLSSLGATLTTVSARRRADPRRLGPLLRGELDWVVMKALEKDRRRRYETANDFAADVMNYLADRPVGACPPSVWYRFAKFARRNRATLVTGLLVTLALVTGTALSTTQAIRATRAERQAEARSRLARRAVDRMYTQVAEKWLAQQPKMTALQREFLEEALVFYQQFAAEQAEDLPTRLEALRARRRAAMIEQSLGRDDRAESAYRAMLRELEALSARYRDDASCSEELAWTLAQLAGIHWSHNRFQDAEPLERRSIAIREVLVARNPANREYRSQLAATLLNLGITYTDTGRHAEAEPILLRAREMFARLHAEAPDDAEITARLAQAEDSLGRFWGRSGRRPDAERSQRRSVQLREQLLAGDPGNPDHRNFLATGLINLNSVASEKQEIPDRDRRIIAILSKLAEEFPDRPRHRELLSVSQMNHAITLKELGKIDEAKQVVRSSIAMAEQLATDFPSYPEYRAIVAKALDLLTGRQLESGEADAARGSARRACEVWEALVADFPDKVDYRRSFAEFLTNEAERRLTSPDAALRHPAEAAELARRACELAPGEQLGWMWLGVAEYSNGGWDAAIRAAEKCISVRGDGGWAFQHLVLAVAHARRGDSDEAREWYAKVGAALDEEKWLRDMPRWLIDEAKALRGAASLGGEGPAP